MSKAVVLLAEGFEEIEALAVVDVLRRADVDTQMVSIGASLMVNGAHGIPVKADQLLDVDALTQLSDAVILPGGMPGAEHLAASDAVKSLLRQAKENGSIIAAICAAPMALDAAGVLGNSRYTCYPGFERRISSGRHTAARVETDGETITGKGAGVAIEFALELVAHLKDQATANKLRDGMLVAIPE